MTLKRRTRVAFLLLFSMLFVNAQTESLMIKPCPEENQNIMIAHETSDTDKGTWYDYFDSNDIHLTSIGVSRPDTFSCAICFTEEEGLLLGKKIKGLKFYMYNTKNIKDLKIWLSKTLPGKPEDATIACKSIPITPTTETIVLHEEYFDQAYTINNRDLYAGYTFTVTACETEDEKFPIFIVRNPERNVLLIRVGNLWNNLNDGRFGALALSVYAEDGDSYVLGDVNYDEIVDVKDLTSVVRFILNEKKGAFNVKAADIDRNNIIDIVDVTSVSDIILGRYKAPEDNVQTETNDNVLLRSTDRGYDVMLSAENNYRAFQMDVVIPETTEGVTVIPDKTLSKTHGVSYKNIGDGRYRIVCYSGNSRNMSDISRLFSINTKSSNIKIENIKFVTPCLTAVSFKDVCMADATTIKDVNADERTGSVYTIEGLKVNKSAENLEKGIYIVKGKKIIIK